MKRGCPERIISTEMSKVKFNVDNKRLNNRQKKGIPFVFTLHSKRKVLQNIKKHHYLLRKVLQNIIKKHHYLLYMNDGVKRVFAPKQV